MMRPAVTFVSLLLGLPLAHAQAVPAPTPQSVPVPNAPAPTASAPAGGTIHGTVKDGNIPLPGVSVTASNSLTGKRYSTTTDVTGAYSLVIPQNGRYVLRTELSAFAASTKTVLLNASAQPQTIDFSIELASRAQQQEQAQATTARTAGSQALSLLGAASDLIQAGGSGDSGASLPSLAANPDLASGDSVAVTGQNGTTNPFAGIDFSGMRDQAELNQSLSGGGPGGGGGRGFGGGGGGLGGGGGGFRGGGRPNFRNFKPNQPHGALFWNGGNGAINAEDFALRGQSFAEPAYESNRFGATIMTAPYIPTILTSDKNDMLFFTLSGTRTSTPFDQYANVPTAAERSGDFSALTTQAGTPITIYDPASSPGVGPCTAGGNTPGQPFIGNKIPAACIASQATALLSYIPQPTIPGATENYQRLTTTQQNSTVLGFRFMHTFGSAPAGSNPMFRMVRQFLGAGTPGITQSMNANFNLSHTASDSPNIYAPLGGKNQSHQYSLQLGYSIGKGRLVNNVTGTWNRTNAQGTNFFTNLTDVASQIGLSGLPSASQLWGLPDVTLNQFTGMNEDQPSFSLQQTVGIGESSSWVHAKHNIRWGADFRRVYSDMIGNTNSTGTYVFSGLFTEQPGTSGSSGTGNTGPSGLAQTGSSLADMLLGLPQETSIQADYQATHLRENNIDGYAQDDWRAMKNVTFLFGLRYDYFSPYSEEHDRLATLDTDTSAFDIASQKAFATVANVTSNAVGTVTSEKYPHDLIYPEKNNLSPRLGFAVHPWKDTTIRGGYGINYTVGQYVKFVDNFAFEPPYADVQNNVVQAGDTQDMSGVLTCTSFCLSNGFTVPRDQQIGNYAVNRNYRLPYVQVWNLNVQRTIPWQIVLNFGYNGSKGSRLDIIDAPGRYVVKNAKGIPIGTTLPTSYAPPDTPPGTPSQTVAYDYEDSVAFSNYNAFTFSARKRLSGGISLQETYTYSHSIDDATSIGGNGGSGNSLVQNWQNIKAEESNSSFDIRNKVNGNFIYELPFGPDTHLLTADWFGHALANVNFSGSYEFASGSPLTPHYNATVEDVSRGTTNSLRPDRVPGVPLFAGGGKLDNWFNKDAFTAPAGLYGDASRLSIPGPGTVSINMSLSKSVRFGDTRTLEMRATADNVFNTVQYSGVDTTLGNNTYGEVTSTAAMRSFTFMGRYRF